MVETFRRSGTDFLIPLCFLGTKTQSKTICAEKCEKYQKKHFFLLKNCKVQVDNLIIWQFCVQQPTFWGD